MSLTEEYREMFDRQTREQDELAEKYAKHKIGSKINISGKQYFVAAVFPEEYIDDVQVMYILKRKGEEDLWIAEKDLDE